MKQITTLILVLIASFSFSQEMDKEQLLALKKANDYVYKANNLIGKEDFVSAEMAYRKAISKQPENIAGIYNLGNSYYSEGNFEEALYRLQEAAKNAATKAEKHKAFHNIGNALMQNKQCKEAVEAFKNALRNDPTDDETRYNLGIAKACEEQQKQDQKDDNKDDQNKDNEDKKDQDKNQDNKEDQDKKDKEGDNKEEDKKDEGDQDKKEGEDKKDEEGKPKDEKENKGKGDKDEDKQQPKPKPQPGQLSPQQIKSLLEAMNNQEQKVQEKMNAEKQKGIKVKTDKDW
ncbi:tetratricopeptide repeat protein [Snuella sedimenti]|uniref:Tetratricopeptide repeat protein n=1 Tax=Snuella sedimenti TaxID=2798802 RepID=A0A8J7J0N9_9FLAO|nr:tetratricopeptide repeat protein [Snuella sedimenti]MBJ6367387.1 tetratricopeptide repeat protein [Snuella sedimenti]